MPVAHQHYFRPKNKYELCNKCVGRTCTLTDYFSVWGFNSDKRIYGTLVSCGTCKHHWLISRDIYRMLQGPASSRSFILEKEIGQEWVDAVGF